MKVPLLDLKPTYLPLRDELIKAVTEVMDEQRFILGTRVEELERVIAEGVGVSHAVACASGSDALLLSLMALDIGEGDEVITTPYSFFATAGCIARLGARPVFVDIDPETFNIDAQGIEEKISPRTRAILPVHLFGQCADMDVVMKVADAAGLPVIEDAAQALGGRWAGRPAGSWGSFGCFSFFPSKNLGGFGDGGIITVNDSSLADRLRCLRAHGARNKYFHDHVGLNSRLDAVQAAILLVKYPHLEAWTAARQHNACRYYGIFEEFKLLDTVELPVQRLEASHVYNQFVIRVHRREELREFLRARGVGTAVYYPKALHRQTCFSDLAYPEGAFPNANIASENSLAIPVGPELVEEQLRHVVSSIRDFYSGATA